VKYYKTDSRRISFREYWHLSRKRGFLIAWLNKILGRRLNLTTGIPEPQPFRDKIVERESLSPLMLERFDQARADFQRLGFNEFWLFRSPISLTGGISCALLALHPAKTTTGKVIYAAFRTREQQVVTFQSELSDGTILSTTNKRRDFDPPPDAIVERYIGESAAGLWERHQKKLETLQPHNPPVRLADFSQLAAFEDKLIQRSFDDKIRRGIWVEMTDAEVAALRAKRLPPPIPQ
jgi:hypothetical protein